MEFIDNDFSNNKLYVEVPFEFKDKIKNKYPIQWDDTFKTWYVYKTIGKDKLKDLLVNPAYNFRVRVRKHILTNPEQKDKDDANFSKIFFYYSIEQAVKLFDNIPVVKPKMINKGIFEKQE